MVFSNYLGDNCILGQPEIQKYMLVITYTVDIENVMILKLLFHINPRADDPGFHLHTFLVDYVTPFFPLFMPLSVLVGYTMLYHVIPPNVAVWFVGYKNRGLFWWFNSQHSSCCVGHEASAWQSPWVEKQVIEGWLWGWCRDDSNWQGFIKTWGM